MTIRLGGELPRLRAPGDGVPEKYVAVSCSRCGGAMLRLNGAYLRWLRQTLAVRVSLRQLAAQARVSAAFVSDVELGRRNLSATAKRSRRLLRAYGLAGTDVEVMP